MCCGIIRLYYEFFYNCIFWSYPELLSKIGTGVHIILVGLEGFGGKLRRAKFLFGRNFRIEICNKDFSSCYHSFCWTPQVFQYHVQVSIYIMRMKDRSGFFSQKQNTDLNTCK